MPDFPKLPIINQPPAPKFPELPILEPDPPRLTLREKYGGLYYLGIGGLIISILLVGSFFVQLYQTRDLWAAFLVLANSASAEPARYDAAWLIAHDTDANDVQRMTFALQKELPKLARYIIAEGLTTEAIRSDPKEYALMVARSESWPDWLRLMLARPMAYGVGQGYRIAWEPIDELRARSDKALGLWMTYTRAVMEPGDAPALAQLRAASEQPGMYHDLAGLLLEAALASGADRVAKLDEATVWLRRYHPPCAQVWEGWEVVNGTIVPRPIAVKATPAPPWGFDERKPTPP